MLSSPLLADLQQCQFVFGLYWCRDQGTRTALPRDTHTEPRRTRRREWKDTRSGDRGDRKTLVNQSHSSATPWLRVNWGQVGNRCKRLGSDTWWRSARSVGIWSTVSLAITVRTGDNHQIDAAGRNRATRDTSAQPPWRNRRTRDFNGNEVDSKVQACPEPARWLPNLLKKTHPIPPRVTAVSFGS